MAVAMFRRWIGRDGTEVVERPKVARDFMKPIPARLSLQHTSALAAELMDAVGQPFLVVVAPVTGKLLGIVRRRALERRCQARGHDPEHCPLVRHLTTDIDFCLESESLSEIFDNRATGAEAVTPRNKNPRERRRLRRPLIVVNESKVPVGLLSRRYGRGSRVGSP
jgi:hypothetical protein